ncbi:MAG: glycosyltransferase family 4 protein, partial [Proteobacteria bacterium]|nr:glycosyltransferase family 4 protein [Pseudomonadota bacterium]
MQNTEIWFWQPLVTPHMTGLARALVAIGYTVHYVCPELLSDNRRMLGWSNIDLGAVRLHVIEDTQQARLLVSQSSAEAEHICSGFRVNRIFGDVQTELARLGRKHWVIIEQVREMHWYHFLKRPLYRILIQRNQPMLKGILAIGADTADWLQARGANPDSIYPFTYFIESPYSEASFQAGSKHQVLFIGEMIPLKKLDLLIDAMEPLKDELQLIAIGSGPCRDQWQEQARKAGIDSQWPGPVPHEEIGNYLARGSCLVLPSEHDGWGVVVSESMMMGTPAICSHRCG